MPEKYRQTWPHNIADQTLKLQILNQGLDNGGRVFSAPKPANVCPPPFLSYYFILKPSWELGLGREEGGINTRSHIPSEYNQEKSLPSR